MARTFKARLIRSYTKDKRWAKIKKPLQDSDDLDTDAAKLRFDLEDDLISHEDMVSGQRRPDDPRRSDEGHPSDWPQKRLQSYCRSYDTISKSWYIHELSKKLPRAYGSPN